MNALDNASIEVPHHDGLTPIVLPRARSSKPGVSVEYVPDPARQWYVLRILYGHARQIADVLIQDGHYAYVALIWKVERKDGRIHKRLVPFLNLLFAYLTAQEAADYVKDSPDSRFITYYYDHFSLNCEGRNPPLTISDHDVRQIVRATAIGDEHVMEVDLKTCRFISDDPVVVIDGPFKGITGRVARIARQHRVVIHIKGLSSGLTTAYIPPYYLRKLDPEDLIDN